MGNDTKPIAIFYAGTNGSGKSSLREVDVNEGINKNIDPDAIARKINSENPRGVDRQAGVEAIRQFDEAIKNRESFTMETTLTGKSALRRMQQAKDAGFEVRLRYVGLESADMNVRRVANRVAGGGHHIDENVIRKRWQESLDNLPKAVAIADQTIVRDNSGIHYKDCLIVNRGQIQQLENQNLPKWVQAARPEISKELGIKPQSTSIMENIGAADARIGATTGFRAIAKGAGVVGAGIMIYDAADTKMKYDALSAQGNQFGADALLHEYVGRTGGGIVGGFAAGAIYGATFTSWSGPGALVAGAVGGVVGAYGGEAIAHAYTEYKMNHQVGENGTTYAYADGKWQTSNWTQANHPAPQDQIATLEYKRVSAVAELALANPQHLDTQKITLTDASGQQTEYNHGKNGWTKEVVDSYQVPNDVGFVGTHSEPVTPELSKQLDQVAAARKDANEHYSDNVAKAYMTDYMGKGFVSDDRPIPESVTNALHLPSEMHVKDPVTGQVWQRSPKGEFTQIHTVEGHGPDGPVYLPQVVHAQGEDVARLNKEHQANVQFNREAGAGLVAQKFQDMQQQQQQQPQHQQPAHQDTAQQGHAAAHQETAQHAPALSVHASKKEATDHMLAALLSDDHAVMHAGLDAGFNTHAVQQSLQHANHVATQAAQPDPARQAQHQPVPQPAQGAAMKQ